MSAVLDPMVLAPDKRTRALVAILLTAFLAGIAMGSAMPMVSMAMEIRGQSSVAIGWVVAAAPIALLSTSPFIGPIVNRFGLLGSMVGGAVITMTAFFIMPAMFGPVPWFILRCISGIGIAVLWILGETWINTVATTANRGKVIMAYTMLLTLGFLVGPALAQVFGVESWLTFYVAGALIGLSVLPLWIARDAAPPLPESPSNAFTSSFRAAPLIMSVALIAGFTDAAQISFLPVYAVRMGLDPNAALTMLMVLVGGSCGVLLVTGWLADRIDRRSLLLICLIIACAMGGLLPFVLNDPVLVWPVLAIWGGTTFSLYSVALVILGDRFSPALLAGANAAFVAMFEVGSVGGPVVIGYAIDLFGPNGMPAVLVAVCIPLFVLAYIRRGKHSEDDVPAKKETAP
ncbi:MAG: MFS transporter [Rhodospirillales bacterium]